MARLVVHDRAARADLIDIWLYSYEQFGERQANRYLDRLGRAFERLAEDPESGTLRDALRPGYWSRRVQSHVVFYTFDEDELRVRRVLHGAMDPDRHLS